MARRETSLSTTLLYIVGIRHTLMLPGIDDDMREFGQLGIRKHERELLAANRAEIDTLLTMLKLRDDWQGREMAWHLQWLFVEGRDTGAEAGAVQVLTGPLPKYFDVSEARQANFFSRSDR
jgi:hypothetical protein